MEGQPAEQGVDEDESKTGQGRGYERRCAHNDAAEDGAQHDDNDVVEGGFFTEGADACDTQEGKSETEGDDGATDHLETVQVFAVAEECGK